MDIFVGNSILSKGMCDVYEAVNGTSLICLGAEDINSVMKDARSVCIGVGFANGSDRAERAVRMAVNSLPDNTVNNAKAIILSIAGDSHLGTLEIDNISNMVKKLADEDAELILGANVKQRIDCEIRVTIIAIT